MLIFRRSRESIPRCSLFWPDLALAKTWSMTSEWSSNRKLHMKPKEPCAKVMMGGIKFPENYLAAHKIVPSPPIVTM